MNPKPWEIFRSRGLALLAALMAAMALSARPAARAQANVIPSGMRSVLPCALPISALPSPQLVVPLPGIQGTLPGGPASGDPVLEITCLSLDRDWYLEGMPWQATVLVENVGAADLNENYHVFLETCRNPGGAGLVCTGGALEAISGAPLSVGGADLRSSAVQNWAPPLDPIPTDYVSVIPGLPDDGLVFVRAHVTYFVAGTGLLETNAVLALATYPRGPATNDLSLDADDDGWSTTEGDCDDANSAVYPWANETLGDGFDNDCQGGDLPQSACPGVEQLYHNGTTCVESPNVPTLPSYDNDGDGYQAGDNPALDPGDVDCDDFNSAIHPGALEQPDGEDDNCNGMVDEGWAEPDWVIEDFTLTREIGPEPLFPELPWTWDSSFYNVGGIRYEVTLGNAGDFMGEDLSSIQAISIEIPFTGQIVASGTSGFIPYGDLPDGEAYGCDARGLVARITANGIFGEANFSNNVAVATLGSLGVANLDFRFASAPTVAVNSDRDALSVDWNRELVGDCPPISTGVDNQLFDQVNTRVYVEGSEVYNETLARVGATGFVSLPDRLRGGDRVCLEITLDPNDGMAEVDELNNNYLQLLTFRNPVIGPPHFDLEDAWSEGPGYTCASGEGIGSIGVAAGALSSSGGVGIWLAGLGGAILMGALGGGLGLLGRRMIHLTGSPATAVVVLGLGAGAVMGGVGAAALVGGLASRTGPPIGQAPPVIEAAALPSCDLFVDPASASPAEGSQMLPGDRLILDLGLAARIEDPFQARFELVLTSPAGERVGTTWVTDPSGEDLPPLNPVLAAYAAGSGMFSRQGTFAWEIARGEAAVAAGRFAALCAGSDVHHFVVGVSSVALAPPTGTPEPGVPPPTSTPTASPTSTPSPSPSPHPPTATRTPTAIPDTAGPSIKSVSDSPDPIYVNQPKGCTPTTSTVTAAISDPSGVASAEVIFFHTTIGSVAMSNTGGNNWQATLGPYAGVGDGTVDYQIHATDSHGNVTDSTFYQITVLACIP